MVLTVSAVLFATLHFLFAEPISSEKLPLIESLPNQECWDVNFMQSLGLKKWQLWIQDSPCLCIHSIEAENMEQLFTAFREQISLKNPLALKWHKRLLDLLGTDYSQQNTLKTQKLLELNFDSQEELRYPYCYVLPLQPGRLESHRHYCDQAMGKNREITTSVCRAFGMLSLHKWVQEIEGKNYILYFQEMKRPIAEGRAHFFSLKNQPKALEGTRSLRADTGLSFEELLPDTRCIYSIE